MMMMMTKLMTSVIWFLLLIDLCTAWCHDGIASVLGIVWVVHHGYNNNGTIIGMNDNNNHHHCYNHKCQCNHVVVEVPGGHPVLTRRPTRWSQRLLAGPPPLPPAPPPLQPVPQGRPPSATCCLADQCLQTACGAARKTRAARG